MNDIAASWSPGLDRKVPPAMTLRGGNAADAHREAPPFDPVADRITPEYLEAWHWGIAHLDSESWRFYLPHLLDHALRNIANPASNATQSLLFSLRPPDRDPPRFGALTAAQTRTVAAVLDRLASHDKSVWQEPAMAALEEYWAPGATYR